MCVPVGVGGCVCVCARGGVGVCVCARARTMGIGGRCELRAHRTPTSKQGNPQ